MLNLGQRIAGATVAALVVASAEARAQPPKLGPEFQVNVYTPGYQTRPDVAIDAGGDFVVVWESDPPSSEVPREIYGRRFASDGLPIGAAFRVRTHSTTYEESDPAVAMRDDGSFVVVWHSDGNRDGDGQAILAQRFNSAGGRLGAEFVANSTTEESQSRPAIAMRPDGGFVVAWEDHARGGSFPALAARVFASNGSALGPDFQVNTYSSGQSWPDVGVDSAGDFLVAWTASLEDGDNAGIFARRFDSSGDAVGGEMQVNSHTPAGQFTPAIGVMPDGGFRIAWMSRDQDGDGYGVFARHLDADGTALGVELQVNAYTTSHQSLADIAVDPSGDFVIVWQSFGQDGSSTGGSFTGIIAQRFAADGSPEAPEFVVNSYTPLPQIWPAVAMDPHGGMVVVWSSTGYYLTPGRDGSGSGIFAQRLGDLIAFDVDGNGSFGALTDALVLVRHGFGFRGDSLIAGAIDEESCTRCGAEEVETFIENLGAALDVDGNGQVEPLTDELVTLRWAFGFDGAGLVAGVTGIGCDRCAPEEIDDYLTLWAD